MTQYINKAAIENILHKLWKKDTGFENIDIAQIAYNRALQDVQCEIDTLEVQEEPVSEEQVKEDTMTISKEWFEHCKKSWYNEGYIDGEYNRDRQFEKPVSEDSEN
jgi:biotin synthase-related radical SAM superfamily protein